MIHFLCPFCSKSHKARDLDGGKKCRCKHCDQVIDIPGTQQSSTTVLAASADIVKGNDQTESRAKSADVGTIETISNSNFYPIRRFHIVVFVVSVFFAIAFAAWLLQVFSYQPRIVKAKKPFMMHQVDPHNVFKGTQTYLCQDNTSDQKRGNTVVAMKDRESYLKWLKSENAGDKYGLRELIESGSAVEIEPQTECLMLTFKYDFLQLHGGLTQEIEVRIIEGPYEGKVFFISSINFCVTDLINTRRRHPADSFNNSSREPPPPFRH